jgi:hypothetical protein
MIALSYRRSERIVAIGEHQVGFPAVRDFGPAYVGFGSISALLAEATRPSMSAMPSIATKAVRGSETSRCAISGHWPASVDHLVGTQKERFRDRQAERLGGFEINDKLELCRVLHRQVGRLLALEDAIDRATLTESQV